MAPSATGTSVEGPVIFYPALTAPFPFVASVIEQHAPGLLVRTLREQTPIVALLDHNPAERLGSTEDGSLRLVLERDGVHAELDVPSTAPGRRLRAALAAGRISGASFSFRPLKGLQPKGSDFFSRPREDEPMSEWSVFWALLAGLVALPGLLHLGRA